LPPLTLPELLTVAEEEGASVQDVRAWALPAVRLVTSGEASRLGGSRLGGLPDLPEGAKWPTWDVRTYDERELEEAEARAKRAPTDHLQQRFEELRARMPREPLPLAFLAQLALSDLPEPASPARRASLLLLRALRAAVGLTPIPSRLLSGDVRAR
jgi:hypothetical protein